MQVRRIRIAATLALLLIAACSKQTSAGPAQPSDDELIRNLFQNAAKYTQQQDSNAMDSLLCASADGATVENPMIDELTGEVEEIEYLGSGRHAAKVSAKSSKVWNGTAMTINFDVAKVGNNWMFANASGCAGGSLGNATASVTVAMVGGKAGYGFISSKPAGLHCQGNDSACTANFDPGTVVDISANAFTGAHFISWGGACHGSDPTCRLTLDGTQSVIATFE